MPFDPKPGLVIRYDFLWKEEEREGYSEGRKDRPCAIIVTTTPKDDGHRDVILCPITHSPPKIGESAVEIPYKMARHLKLDDEQCWIKTHQVNTVIWDKDHLPFGVTPAHKNQWAFGLLHKTLSMQAFNQVYDNNRKRTLKNVRREANPDLKKMLKTLREENKQQIKNHDRTLQDDNNE